MKYYLFIITVFVSSISIAQNQVDFGVKGGVNATFFKVTEANFGEDPETDFGFFGGVFVDFKIDKGFHFQPEILYKGINDFKFLNAPMYLKYDVDNNFHLLLGPSLNYFFDFFTNKFKVRADVSLEYDLFSRLNINIKYALGFEELSPNILFFGVGYKL
ncbi:outer membrane beta-barrel protein [Olleya sp. YS]|uniref:outer membrane beta-barrel protein n=1 Tax=Olleya sp. YS TaxID=3028318 RepID=UPI002434479B|nr:outer membrane beta-barrel protein [Olleya sp. YS]WGD34345.1 outer membrane beta-barrel protein [Olleya sp. YS]